MLLDTMKDHSFSMGNFGLEQPPYSSDCSGSTGNPFRVLDEVEDRERDCLY
jgi:hypothetical protein